MGRLILFCLLAFPSQLWVQTERIVDIPTRPGVTPLHATVHFEDRGRMVIC